jgi:hypothetical protein
MPTLKYEKELFWSSDADLETAHKSLATFGYSLNIGKEVSPFLAALTVFCDLFS